MQQRNNARWKNATVYELIQEMVCNAGRHRIAQLLASVIFWNCLVAVTLAEESGLIAHWRFAGDTQDSSGHGHHAAGDGIDLSAAGPNGVANTAAKFDGQDDCLIVPSSPSLQLGNDDFSIAVWIHTDRLCDTVGDILSKFDPAKRQGLNLSIYSQAGVTTSQPNYRNLHFGIDQGRVDSAWKDCGRPGDSLMIHSMAVYDGHLYVGTYESGEQSAGHVYRYDGAQTWKDCGSPDRANCVSSLAVFDGQLYCGTTRYRASGSRLPLSPNINPGGMVYRYVGENKWDGCGRLADADSASSLTVLAGKLYASPWYPPTNAFVYDGGTNWTPIGPNHQLIGMTVFQNRLYGLGNGGGTIFRYEGQPEWTNLGKPTGTRQTYSGATYQGHLHIGTWPLGEVYRLNDDRSWTSLGQLGYNMEVMGMSVYNGKLYAGVLPMADVHRLDGEDTWAWVGNLDNSRAMLRRVWCLCVHDGQLFGGTLPSGHVHSLTAGRMATYDTSFPSGWHHVVASRVDAHLRLFVDGTLVANSSAFEATDYDLTNEQSLQIGMGAYTHFRGMMSDMRIYDRELTADEIKRLATVVLQ
ncbi:MAG: LamG domain-containing protein [Planctomycetota bacterium]|nr:LamG domain-containing protein [Planctomycetota bacterium]